ncbi:MAG: glutamate--tRNA ligase [Pseudomonadota bacterium]|nr:glutamate--tRNA ligase [Desulfobacterales bacterium]MBL6968358.1 glutamate--tRNA ligase [Desulfobacteraceae bacterium]MBL7101597.1 glutamate--tRNA ligase [Desulfobacteraceae bacterium]MBL7171650.1 glutamate--tRNA ligase [Desulfobacteraceae bacterium]MBU0736138.1 glutamate--tRNA ligase [Pseudomonadota bacterium]
MSNEKVVTRFPPSPTGYLHIGGARTALFNWLFSRQKGGKFILRIEDTDEQRSSEEATRAILESMEWLGLYWDEGPYFQSRRYDIYNEFIDRLLTDGQAYHCHCSPEDLDRQRQEARAKGLKPKYDGTCRNVCLDQAPGSVVRLKTPLSGITQFTDLVKGVIRFDNEELDDLIIRRSNGSPTYHLAVVADDISLGMTHIIRGDDHVNNTPRQILIYAALGEPVPKYAHLPMILGPDKTRLSKRHGAMSVLAYRDMGYLPHALLNALVRLGWSYGDEEKFSLEELVEKFSLDNVGKAAGVFNAEKLLDLNAWHIRDSSDDMLAERLPPFLENRGFRDLDEGKVEEVASILKVRSKTLIEMAEGAAFCFEEEISYEEKADNKFLKPDIAGLFEELCERLAAISEFIQENLEKVFVEFLEEKEIKLKKLAQPLRVALTGKTASPGIFEVMQVLGKDRVIERVRNAVVHIRNKKAQG